MFSTTNNMYIKLFIRLYNYKYYMHQILPASFQSTMSLMYKDVLKVSSFLLISMHIEQFWKSTKGYILLPAITFMAIEHSHELLKWKRQEMNLVSSSYEFCNNILWQEFWIASSYISISISNMQKPIQNIIKFWNELYFIKKDVIPVLIWYAVSGIFI